MRHLVNGDATLRLLRETAIPGEALYWPDILMEGPVVNALAGAAEWRQRATYLEAHLRIVPEQYLERIAAARSALAAWDGVEELTLWFEEDLFCQVHLLYLLGQLAQRVAAGAPLTLICPPESLGRRAPADLEALFTERSSVTADRVALARRAWAAYASADPRALEQLLQDDLSAWPLLAQGLRAHLARFPAPASGLNVIETAVLAALRAGPTPFATLFGALSARPALRAYGIGDRQIASVIADLGSGSRPLLIITWDHDRRSGGGPPFDGAEGFSSWNLSLTSDGQAALAGRFDAVSRWPVDRWLGGVRLAASGPVWRWDGTALSG